MIMTNKTTWFWWGRRTGSCWHHETMMCYLLMLVSGRCGWGVVLILERIISSYATASKYFCSSQQKLLKKLPF